MKTTDPEVPTNAELRDRARTLGLPVPPTRTERQAAQLQAQHDAVRTETREHMLSLPTDTKTLPDQPSFSGPGSLWQQVQRRQTRELRRAADHARLTVALGYDPWER